MGQTTSKSQVSPKAAVPCKVKEDQCKPPPESPPPYETVQEPWKIRYIRRDHFPAVIFYREVIQEDGTRWRRYGVADNNHSQPDTTFTCLVKPRSWICAKWFIHADCFMAAVKLVNHRRRYKCRCGFEDIKTGRMQGNMAGSCERGSFWVKEYMKAHDEKCACGAFKYEEEG